MSGLNVSRLTVICRRSHALYNLLLLCDKQDSRILFIDLVGGLVGVSAMPTTFVGIFVHTMLIFLLIRSPGRPRELQIWGILLALSDMGFFVSTGLFYQMTNYGMPWWDSRVNPPDELRHVQCKFLRVTSEFFCSVRINMIMAIVACESLTKEGTFQNPRQRGITVLWSFIVTLISMIQACPVALIYGIFQKNGGIVCAPDPMWSKRYHQFYLVHRLLFIDGLVQVISTLMLCIPLWIRSYKNQKMIAFIQKDSESQGVVNHVLNRICKDLGESCRNLQVILPPVTAIMILRTIQGFSRYNSNIGYFPGSSVSGRKEFVEYLARQSWWNLAVVIEITLTGFALFWWIRNVPQMRDILFQAFRSMVRRTVKETVLVKEDRWTSFKKRHHHRKKKQHFTEFVDVNLTELLRQMIVYKQYLATKHQVKFQTIPGYGGKRAIVTYFMHSRRGAIHTHDTMIGIEKFLKNY